MSRSDGEGPRAPSAKREASSAPDDAPVANENDTVKAKSVLPRSRDFAEPSVIGTPRPSEVGLADDLLHASVEGTPSLPSIPPLPAHGPWRSYKEIVAALSGRIVEAQKPLRVLNAIKWEPTVWEVFKRSRFKDVPPIGPESYEQVLGFDPRAKAAEFEDILRDIEKALPPSDEIAAIMKATALQFRDVVRMLEARGTPTFYGYSRRLYGSPKDKYPDGKTTVRDSAFVLYDLLTNLQDELGPPSPRDVPAAKAVDVLNARLTAYFGESTVRVAEDDGIFADAAAGSDYPRPPPQAAWPRFGESLNKEWQRNAGRRAVGARLGPHSARAADRRASVAALIPRNRIRHRGARRPRPSRAPPRSRRRPFASRWRAEWSPLGVIFALGAVSGHTSAYAAAVGPRWVGFGASDGLRADAGAATEWVSAGRTGPGS